MGNRGVKIVWRLLLECVDRRKGSSNASEHVHGTK